MLELTQVEAAMLKGCLITEIAETDEQIDTCKEMGLTADEEELTDYKAGLQSILNKLNKEHYF